MIFIVGCGHSGTSLLTAVLDTHSELNAVPDETYVCFRGELQDLMEQYGDNWVEKTPMHIHFMDYILQYPENRVIVMWRNKEEVVKSRLFRGQERKYAEDLWEYARASKERWEGHERAYTMHYEDLMRDFDGEVAKLLKFLEKPYEDLSGFWRIKRQWYGGNYHTERRNDQLHQPIDEYAKKYRSDQCA